MDGMDGFVEWLCDQTRDGMYAAELESTQVEDAARTKCGEWGATAIKRLTRLQVLRFEFCDSLCDQHEHPTWMSKYQIDLKLLDEVAGNASLIPPLQPPKIRYASPLILWLYGEHLGQSPGHVDCSDLAKHANEVLGADGPKAVAELELCGIIELVRPSHPHYNAPYFSVDLALLERYAQDLDNVAHPRNEESFRKAKISPRDRWFLKQDTECGPAEIRDMWNGMSDDERNTIDPKNCHRVGKVRDGANATGEAIRRAKQKLSDDHA